MSTNTNPDILGMSDEDFAKLPPPADEVISESAPVEPPAPAEEPEETQTADETQEDTQTGDETNVEQPESQETGNQGGDGDETPPTEDPPADPPPTDEKDKKDEDEKDSEPKSKADEPKIDFEAFYKAVMAPFKANGKLIQLQSVDEVISLMQMGANYTKKMQAIQQYKKYLMMLENNGLLDEQKLSFMIDLDKRNPEAIKKFLKDSNIDPIELDTSSEVNYKGGSHTVTDQEANLATVIEELNSTPRGKETLQSVNEWDLASKKVLLDNPELLTAIHAQRENGIYAKITAEIERRKILGQVGPNVPFLQAYKTIGDELVAKGAIQIGTQPATSAQQPVQVRTPVAVRPAKTPATKAADSKVRAAATTRTVSRPAKAFINPLAMSDEEFLKFEGKV